MLLGRGVLDSDSKKQKLKIRSSAEIELAGTSDLIPKNLFTKLFIQVQGYLLD